MPDDVGDKPPTAVCNPRHRTWSGYAETFSGNVTLRELGPDGDIYGLGTKAPWALTIGPKVIADLYERPGSFGRPNYLTGIPLASRDYFFEVTVEDHGQIVLSRKELVDDADYQRHQYPCWDWDGTPALYPVGISF